MSMAITLLLLIPLLVPLAFKYFLSWKISWGEYAISEAISAILVVGIYAGGTFASSMDTELLNGSVTNTHVWRFSCPTNTSNPCRNGYSCNCVQVPYECGSTDSKGNYQSRTCYRTECDTCYEYDWEQNWYISSNVTRDIEIDRIDRQGANTPPRWSEVNIGDPVTVPHQYKNWVKNSSRSLFKQDPQSDERFAKIIPEYPIKVFDYYKADRIVTANFRLKNEKPWNDNLAYVLGQVGPKKQINTVVVMVKGVDRSYADAVRRSWQGFKKNDAVIFIGLDNNYNIAWSQTYSWSKNEMFNVQSRMFVEEMVGQNITKIDPALFFSAYETIVTKHFVRRSMKEFEYLRGDIPPPTGWIWAAAIFGLISAIGSSIFFHKNDLTYNSSLNSISYRRY